MERIPAACAMNWSIELEKGIRLKGGGHPEDVIEQVGSKLLSWSRESYVSLSASKMYDLIPGEERSFVNTILMRLTDAFLSGNNCMRSSVLKVFLLELRHVKEKGKSYNGILSKQRLPNYIELLKRVRSLFDIGDVKARALALRLLGCWVPLTYDNADVQSMIISSLQSNHVLERKASLFACGCLSLLSDDFVRVVLGKLVDILCSENDPSKVKLSVARAFGEIQCSSLLACKAYKVGKRLVHGSCLEGYRTQMLFSLTKLAVKSVILVPEQVDLLLALMVEESSSIAKSAALKCVRFLCSWGFSHVIIKENVLSTLIPYINDLEIPLLQCDVLKTLHQIFRGLSEICHEDSLDLQSLAICIRDASQSQCMSKKYLSFNLLVDLILCCNVRRAERENCFTTENLYLSPGCSEELSLLLVDNIVSAMKQSDVKQRYSVLSKCIIRLVRGCPTSGLFKYMVTQVRIELEKSNPSLTFSVSMTSCIRSFVIPCLNILIENGQASSEVCTGVKLLLAGLQKVNYFDDDALELVSLYLFLLVSHSNQANDRWIDLERFTLHLVRKMMGSEKHWMIYKVGKHSFAYGLWFSSTFIFRNLIDKVKSDSCRSWLKSLMLLAGAESEIKLLLFPELGAELVNELLFNVDQERGHERREKGFDGSLRQEEREKLSRAHRRICSSKEGLLGLMTENGGFLLQVWFLNLREKGLKILDKLLGLFLSHSHEVDFLSSELTLISRQFHQLAREYDFMIISFMDMDIKSSAWMSRLAFYCSLLAYCIGFPLYFEAGSSGLFLLEDLCGRLSDVDRNRVLDLEGHLPFSDWPGGWTSCSRKQLPRFFWSDEGTLSFCRFAIYGIHQLRKDGKDARHGEGSRGIFAKGLCLLNDVVVKWMGLRPNIPRYFFRLGDCIGSELFIVGDKRSSKELFTLVGNQLCLHLCIQMKNISSIQRDRISTLHCILTVDSRRSSSGLIKIEQSMEMYELLMLHMRKREKVRAESAAVTATAYFCVGPNQLGQGFSTCLLDVSDFPEGVYQIKWHGCCVDDDDQFWSLPALSNEIPFTIRRPFLAM